MSLVNLSQLVNLCDGSDCNQMFLQNLAKMPIGVPVAKHMGVPATLSAKMPIGVPVAKHMGVPATLSAKIPIGVPRANHMGVPAKLSAKIPIGVPRANHMGVPAKLTANMPSAAHMGIPVAHHAKPVVHHVAAPVVHHAMPVVHHAAPKVEVKSMVDWCYKNDSDKARTICPQHAALKAAGHKAVVMPVHDFASAMPAMDLTHDDFHTQNIDVNQIDSAGNVDIGLMNLLAKVDPKHVEIKSMVDWCYKNDSAKAKKICPHHAAMKAAGKKVAVVAPEMAMPALDLTHDVFHTQNIDVNQIDSAGNVDIKIMMI